MSTDTTFVDIEGAAILLGVDVFTVRSALAEGDGEGDEISVKSLTPIVERLKSNGIKVNPRWAQIRAACADEDRLVASGDEANLITTPRAVHYGNPDDAAIDAAATATDADAETDTEANSPPIDAENAPLSISEAAELLECSELEVIKLCAARCISVDRILTSFLPILATQKARFAMLKEFQNRHTDSSSAFLP